MIRFLHVADLHLGLRVTRFDEPTCERLREARLHALDNLKQKAIEHQVHFVLVAGDLFDDVNVPRTLAERTIKQLHGRHMPCPVYVISGNHDPLTPGGVWDRPPWVGEMQRVQFLREPKPVSVPGFPVTLFPCPLKQRKSMDDPTKWIAGHPRAAGDETIRIGLAHGSLNILPNLPVDDHLIPPDAADVLGLDYLALGHWHKVYQHATRGVVRTAYSGTHEPMRFPDADAARSSGWSAYSTDSDADRFKDGGIGTALLVTIDGPGAPPEIQQLDIGRLKWLGETRNVTSSVAVGGVISEFARRPQPELTLLKLTLTGVLDLTTFQRIEYELAPMILSRYHSGSHVNAEGVLLEPDAAQLQSVVGTGVLARVLARLQTSIAQSPEPQRTTDRQALKLLYQMANEAEPS